MRALLVGSLIGLYVYAYQFNISNIGVAATALIIIILLYLRSKREGMSNHAIIIELMCYTVPVAWRSVFGGSFASLPVPWFYIMGVVFILSLLLSKTIKVEKNVRTGMTVSLTAIIILGTIQLWRSIDFNDALKEYITLSFYFLVLIFSVICSGLLSKEDYDRVIKAYILTCFMTAIFIIIQFAAARYMGIILGHLYLAANNRTGYGLMFEDLSSASIYLATAAFMAFLQLKQYKKYLIVFIVIFLGMTASSARTGLIALVVTVLLYTVTRRGFIKKTILFTVCILISIVGLNIYNIVRPGISSDTLFYDNGRYLSYTAAIDIFLQKPFLGAGFGDMTLVYLTGTTNPHFSFLKILTQTGIIYTSLFIGIIVYTLRTAYKDNKKTEMWVLLLSITGACFVPGLFSSRFFTVLMSLVYLRKGDDQALC